MNRLKSKRQRLTMRQHRIRKSVVGTAERPRLAVHVSNKHVEAQIIDDAKGRTIVSITSAGKKDLPVNLTARATWVGSEVAKAAKKAKVKKVVFDRRGDLYHGRLKALADAARNEGMEF